MKTLLTLLALTIAISTQAQELTGRIDLETRAFVKGALLEPQHQTNISLSSEPELFLEWADGSQRFIITPFARLDLGDQNRTHFDLREAYWQYLANTWDLRVGFSKVFWGVTESQHLVDVINQTDLIEGPDGEAKLGQPMVQWTWLPTWGALDVFIMPFFRERTFPGEEGRLRLPLLIDSRNTLRHERVDVAVRWSRSISLFDIGLAHFWGTSREPRFTVASDGFTLNPIYETIHQSSLDAQATVGSWAFKLESITRSGQGDRFYAVVAGFEYTIGNIRNSGYDLGLLAEYHYDSRDALDFSNFVPQPGIGPLSVALFENDVFGGVRLALNDVQDTQMLGGAIVDVDTRTTAFFLEASRRIGDRFTLDVEMRSFLNTDPGDAFYSFRQDSYGQVRLGYHF